MSNKARTEKKPSEASEDIFAQAADQLGFGLAIFDHTLSLIDTNRVFSQITGHSPNQSHPGTKLAALLNASQNLPLDVQKEILEKCENRIPFNKVFTTNQNRPIRVRSEAGRHDQTILYIEYAASKTTEHASQESNEDTFRTYLEVSPAGALLAEMNGDISYRNPRALEIFGYEDTPEEALNVRYFYAYPEDREFLVNSIYERPGASTFHFVGKKRDGTHIPILLTSRLVTIGDKKRVFSWVNDLSHMQAAEKVIEELHEHNRVILSAVRAGIFGVDANNVVQFVNPAAAELLGYKKEDLLGRTLLKLLSTDHRILTPLADENLDGETEMICKNGQILPVKFTISPLKDDKIGTEKVIVFDDISRQIAAEKVLRQAVKEMEDSSHSKSQFLSTMSHELRTPLNSILGFAQLLQLDPTKSLTPEQLEFINHISLSGEHLLKLIDEAMDITSIESGQISLSLQTLNLGENLNDCLSKVASKAAEKNIKISPLEESAYHTVAFADQLRLQQVFDQLLSNAIKYNKHGGEVTVTTTVLEDKVRITIADTGQGFPDDLSVDIFAPFNRIVSHNDAIEGTGLGLTLCKYLVVMMDGNIGYTSTENVGSSFWVDLPLPNEETPEIILKN